MRNLILLLMLVCSADAAEPLDNLTIERAIDIAIQNHPSLAEADANIQVSKARAEAAGKFPNPDAIARMESAPFSSAPSQAEYVAGVSQALPLGGRLSAARQAEDAVTTTRLRDAKLAKLTVIRNVRNAFATALFSSETLNTQTNNAASLRELARITKARAEAGDIGPIDLARIESEEAQSRLEVQEAARLHHAAMDALASSMGNFRTPINSIAGSLEDALAIAAIKAEAFGNEHPAIQSAQSEVNAQEARLKLAKAERIPDVNLDLFYRRLEASRDNGFDVGIRIPIPLFDRNKRVRQAEQELRATEARYDRIQNDVGREQHELELRLRSALATAELLKSEALPKVERVLTATEARYKAGDIALSELLIVRREAAGARSRYAETLRSVMEAWSGLARSSLAQRLPLNR